MGTNQIWLAYDRATGEPLTPEAVSLDTVVEVMRGRTQPTALKTIASHAPGDRVSPETLDWSYFDGIP